MTTLEIILTVIVVLFGITVFICGYFEIKQSKQFEYDESNPFRRYCVKCGSCQCEHHYAGHPRKTWWEEMYPIGNDPNCECHSYAENHG